MPYYHIRVKRIGKRPPYVYEFDLSKKKLESFLEQARKGGPLYLPKSFEWVNERNIEDIDIARTPKKSSHYGIGRLKGESIFEEGKIVTSQFIKKPLSRKAVKKLVAPTQETLSKNVFIVHGRDHKPMKELKAMLSEFGLKPIVLHEQPSGSRTIVEKLEKYSDVGYAFIILTPDDIGGPKHKYDRYLQKIGSLKIEDFCERARQNVILEFGFFIGRLERDRVCCLLKEGIERPSDMDGIVYIPFNKSVKEAQQMIIKELKEAGYKIET